MIVTAYEDQAEGVMEMDADGTGRFVDVVLKPRVTIKRGTFPDSPWNSTVTHTKNASSPIR